MYIIIIIVDGNTEYYLQTQHYLSCGHAFLFGMHCTPSPISEGWYLDDGKIKV